MPLAAVGPLSRDESCWNVKAHIRMPGYKATGMTPRLPSSMAGFPSQPGWKRLAVLCTMMPRRPRLLRPSKRPTRSGARVRRSSVVASTSSWGCTMNGSSCAGVICRVAPCAVSSRRGSMYGSLVRSKTRNDAPRRKSSDAGPRRSASPSSGWMTIRPSAKASLMSRSERSIQPSMRGQEAGGAPPARAAIAQGIFARERANATTTWILTLAHTS